MHTGDLHQDILQEEDRLGSGGKEDGQFHFRHTGFEVAIDIQVSYPIVFRYLGLKLRRVGLEAHIWRSLAMACFAATQEDQNTPGRVYKIKRRKESTELNPEKHQGILRKGIKRLDDGNCEDTAKDIE